MVDKLIPPRRGVPITEKGILDTRTAIYLEENAAQTNESTELTEADPSSINLSSGQLAAINKRVDAILAESLTSDNAVIAKLKKRIEQLENTIINNQNSKVNKKVSALENDFVAPFYKIKYEKLQIKNAEIVNATISEKLKLPLDNNAVDPTIQFGNGDDGFYQEAAGKLAVSLGTIKRFSYSALDFRAEFAANTGAAIRFITPTATVPGFTPNVSDTDTGIGWAGANLLALIAGGVEGLRVSATALTVPTGSWDADGIDINSGDTYQINGTTVLSDNALGLGVTSSSLTSVGTLASLSVTGTISGPSGSWTSSGMDLGSGDSYRINGTQIITSRGAAVPDAAGTLAQATTAINTWLARARAHGLISS